MSQEQNRLVAQKLLAAMAAGADPDQVAAFFTPDVRFEIPGDAGALPWIGRKTGRAAAADFVRDTRRLIRQVRFDIEDILAGDDRAVVVGELATEVLATGKVIESSFAIVLTVADGKIARFQMLEDSFAVSRAARG